MLFCIIRGEAQEENRDIRDAFFCFIVFIRSTGKLPFLQAYECILGSRFR